jgi:hypothetical protein
MQWENDAVNPQAPLEPTEPDSGLRRVITWTLVALVAALLVSAAGVYLVTRWWGH